MQIRWLAGQTAD